MASQILPVWCPAEWACDIETHKTLLCGARGLKSHGGLCQRHRAEAVEALAARATTLGMTQHQHGWY